MVELLTPDLEQAQRFLQALDPDGIFTFQTFDDDKDRSKANKKRLGYDPLAHVFQGTLNDHIESLVALQRQGAGVFVMVNKGDMLGRTNRNVIEVRAHFVDLDGAPVEPVLHADAPPHIVVESSPDKWHAYWRVQGASLADFKDRQHALADRFSGDPSVCDLCRVMRLPGFWHLKGTPFQTRLVTPTPEANAL